MWYHDDDIPERDLNPPEYERSLDLDYYEEPDNAGFIEIVEVEKEDNQS